MTTSFAWIVAAGLSAMDVQLDSLRVSALHDLTVTNDRKSRVWPGPGIDIGLDPWHLRYTYQTRYFGDGLDGESILIEGVKPRMEKARHRLTGSWQHWKGFARFDLGAGWVWTRLDELEIVPETRQLYQLDDERRIRNLYEDLHWFKLRKIRSSDPVGFAGIGLGRREWWTIAARVEYCAVVAFGLSFELHLH